MAELVGDGGLELSQDLPPSGPVKINNTLRPVSVLATSVDSIVVGAEASPSNFTGLSVAPIPDPYPVVTIDEIDGTIENVSGSFLIMGGTIAVQPVKSGGGVSQLDISTETAFDGVNFQPTPFSLRNFEIANNGESFLTSPAAFLLPPGAKTRFLVWETGGGVITLTAPSSNPAGNPVTGASVSMSLHGYIYPI